MSDIWELGQWSGYRSLSELYSRMTCGYCGYEYGYDVLYSIEKERADQRRALIYEVLKCGNCANISLAIRNSGDRGGLQNYVRIPHSTKHIKPPDTWPEDVGRLWLQAVKAIDSESWDGAAMLIRSCLQLSLRHAEATGDTLYKEIDSLVATGALPPLMKDWATEVRLLGNYSSHPKPGEAEVNSDAVKIAMRFLEFLLRYLFTLPVEIDRYRTSKTPETKP